MFLRDWSDFAANTEVGIVLEFFLELMLDLENFCPKKGKVRKGVRLKIICLSKREKESNLKQVRRRVRRPVR